MFMRSEKKWGKNIVKNKKKLSQQEVQEKMNILTEKCSITDLLDNIEMGAYIVDPERRILFWNKAASQITGYFAEDVIGTACKDDILEHEDIHGERICDSELCPLVRSMYSHKPDHVPFAVYCKDAHGKKISLDVYSIPLIYENTLYGAIELFQHYQSIHFEMENAREIQKKLIPQNLPSNVQIFFHPCENIGGDMLFYREPWYVLYDVSGHGTSAAMIATSVISMLQRIFTPDVDIQQVGQLMEEEFQVINVMDMYFTALVIKKESKKRLSLKSFGHVHPLVIDKKGSINEIEVPRDFPVGFSFEHNTETADIQMKKHSRFLAFTDGVFQPCSDKKGLSKEDLYKLFLETDDLPSIYRSIRHSCLQEEQSDDMTILQMKF